MINNRHWQERRHNSFSNAGTFSLPRKVDVYFNKQADFWSYAVGYLGYGIWGMPMAKEEQVRTESY